MPLFDPNSVGAIKQYAADDISAPAIGQRKWWQNAATTAASNAATAATTAAKDAAQPPTFTTLTNIKNPEVNKAQSQLFSDYNKNRNTGSTLFEQYLNEAQGQAQQNKDDLAKQRASYDLTGFKSALNANRANQESLIGQARDNAVKFAAGNVERNLLGSGLPTSGSSELQATAAREFAQAALPYEQQIAAGRNQDLNRVEDLTLQTAGASAAANRAYLANLLLPAQASTEMFRANAGNLSALQSIDANNRFYGLYTPYQNRVPATPIPLASAHIPAIPDYRAQSGYTPAPPVANRFNFGNTGIQPDNTTPANTTPARRSDPEEAYKEETGYYPDQDPSFSPKLYQTFGGRFAYNPAAEKYKAEKGVYPYEDPNFDAALYRAYGGR